LSNITKKYGGFGDEPMEVTEKIGGNGQLFKKNIQKAKSNTNLHI
jgi:hypothetical protein